MFRPAMAIIRYFLEWLSNWREDSHYSRLEASSTISCIRVVRGDGGGKCPFNINCTVPNESFFFRLPSWREGEKIFVVSGGKGCMYIKHCFTPNFPLFLMRLLRKLKLLIPIVGLPAPPSPPHLLVLLATLRLWSNESTFFSYSVVTFKRNVLLIPQLI